MPNRHWMGGVRYNRISIHTVRKLIKEEQTKQSFVKTIHERPPLVKELQQGPKKSRYFRSEKDKQGIEVGASIDLVALSVPPVQEQIVKLVPDAKSLLKTQNDKGTVILIENFNVAIHVIVATTGDKSIISV